MEDTIEFDDQDSFSSNSNDKFGFKYIVLTHLFDCVRAGSKEMTSGGITNKIDSKGKSVTIKIPNQREIYINSVDMLWILLKPSYEKEKKNKNIEKEYLNIKEEINKDEELYKKRYIEIERQYASNKSLKESNLKDLYDKRELKLVQSKRKLLTLISHLLDQLNYFDEHSMVF